MATPSVTAVILTWNNFDDTDECIRSVLQSDYPLDLLLVDNGSTDGSGERLCQTWKGRVEFLRLPENRWVAAGYNAGIERALDSGADHVLLLNNDTVVDPSLVRRLLPAFDAFPRAATVSPVITYYDNPDKVWFAGGRYSRNFGLSRHVGLNRPLEASASRLGRLFPSAYVPTCATLTPAAVYREVGLLDPAFLLSHDDIDWALRVRAAGYMVMVLGEPLVRHKVSVSAGYRGSNTLTDTQAYHFARGSMLLAARHYRGPRLVPYLAGQLLVRLPYYSVQMVRAGRPSGVRAYLSGLRDGLGQFRGDRP